MKRKVSWRPSRHRHRLRARALIAALRMFTSKALQDISGVRDALGASHR